MAVHAALHSHQMYTSSSCRLTGQPSCRNHAVLRSRQRRSRHASAANSGAGGDEPPQQQQQPQQVPQPSTSQDNEPLWWVEKFEQQLAAQQQATAGETASAPAPTPNAAQPQQQRSPQPIIPWPKVALQLLQLTVAVSALILWPASLYCTGLYSSKVWLLFLVYMLFFGGGSVWRLLQFGPLASRKKDQQAKSAGTRAAWLLFVAMMPVLHWGALGSYMKSRAAAAAKAAAAGQWDSAAAAAGPLVVQSALSLYDLLGLGMLSGAVWLNWQAARHLGKAYDRVVQPEALVTSGPYAYVQHPIYSSYMLLFCGYAMMLHGVGYAVLALAVCLLYYKNRVALEAGVLQEAFKEQYSQYAQKTKLFVPFVF